MYDINDEYLRQLLANLLYINWLVTEFTENLQAVKLFCHKVFICA